MLIVDVDHLVFHFDSRQRKRLLAGEPVPLFIEKSTGASPVSISIRQTGHLFWTRLQLVFDFRTIASNQNSPVIIRHGDLAHLENGWDWNGNDNAMEIVNDMGQPVFQCMYITATHLRINGIFLVARRVFFMTDINQTSSIVPADSPSLAQDLASFHLPPLFKHPGSVFPGIAY
jgi:hypothetical protein